MYILNRRHGPWERSLIGYRAAGLETVPLTAAAALLSSQPHPSSASHQVTSLSCDICLICLLGCLTKLYAYTLLLLLCELAF